jgi:outer membrane receptor protein involved in Fe transport
MNRKFLTVALCAAIAAPVWTAAVAQSAPVQNNTQDQQDQQDQQQTANQQTSDQNPKQMKGVMVTGSLIPQTEIETATPITTITAEDIKVRGFSTVAEALQSSSFAVGGVQGQQTSASFTQGAETLSFFGLPVGFVKYLINGKPMGNFPALYNGSDTFNNIAGIPASMVDHIDILPGGQSSLYGSDAIAGVINIVLKTDIEAPIIDVRYGWHTGGGGATRRVSLSDGWQIGKFKLLGGVQYENTQPIWGFDRSLTRQYYRNGTSAPTASRDFLVYSATKVDDAYYFLDPNKCANVTGLFRGTEGVQHRENSGDYCGTLYSPGYRTVKNGSETANGYLHATFDITPTMQLYGDLLYKYSETKYATGAGYTFWSSADYGYIYDPNLDDFVTLQHAFAPEEVGGYQSIENKQTENAYFLTLGINGFFGNSDWEYDLGLTHSDDHLLSRGWARLSDAIDNYFETHVLGPQYGYDPYYNAYPVFKPDYAAFYKPIPVSDLRGFTGYTTTNAKTWDNLLRGQVTNSALFSLPGGDAGLAVVLEGGNNGWDYTPDPRLLNGDIWGTTDVQGSGHRSRYAATAELRLPVLSMLTVDLSGRRDSFNVADNTVSKNTYSVGLEFRPFESLLFRGRYGTAFKVPTLSDQFQGLSGYYSFVTDYYNCALLGYSGSNIGDCPSKYGSVQFFGQQSGNTALQPINAKVWSYGVVWAPSSQFSTSLDYYHTDINNEVSQQSADQLSNLEWLCRTGQEDINSPSCQDAISKITRTATGDIDEIFTPKVNVSNEIDNALVASVHWNQKLGTWGSLHVQGSYSDVLKHEYQQYPGDPYHDLLREPGWSSDFKDKANASATLSAGKWSGTLYVNRYGSSPNYLARVTNNYTDEGTGRLAPWIIYNASVRYMATQDLTLSLLVNNLFNKMPPEDHSYPGTEGSPYNSGNYNIFGRTIYIEANYKFGYTK